MCNKNSSGTTIHLGARKLLNVTSSGKHNQESEQVTAMQSKEATFENLKDKGMKVEENLQENGLNDLANYQIARDKLQKLKNAGLKNYSFLTDILSEITTNDNVPIEATKPTKIDMQLSALRKRIELNQILLERTSKRAKEVDFTVEKSKMMTTRNSYYDEDIFLKMKDAKDTNVSQPVTRNDYPGIENLRRTMANTVGMLECIKKIVSGEMQFNDLPAELHEHMGIDSSNESGNNCTSNVYYCP